MKDKHTFGGMTMKKSTTNTTPLWVSDVYQPEGADRPSFNRPVSAPVEQESEQEANTLAQVVSRANRLDSRR